MKDKRMYAVNFLSGNLPMRALVDRRRALDVSVVYALSDDHVMDADQRMQIGKWLEGPDDIGITIGAARPGRGGEEFTTSYRFAVIRPIDVEVG